MKFILLFLLSSNIVNAQGILFSDLKQDRANYVITNDPVDTKSIPEVKNSNQHQEEKVLKEANNKYDSVYLDDADSGLTEEKPKKKKLKKEVVLEYMSLDIDLFGSNTDEGSKELKIIDKMIAEKRKSLKGLDVEDKIKRVHAEFKMENTIMDDDSERMANFSKMDTELKEDTDLNVIEIDDF